MVNNNWLRIARLVDMVRKWAGEFAILHQPSPFRFCFTAELAAPIALVLLLPVLNSACLGCITTASKGSHLRPQEVEKSNQKVQLYWQGAIPMQPLGALEFVSPGGPLVSHLLVGISCDPRLRLRTAPGGWARDGTRTAYGDPWDGKGPKLATGVGGFGAAGW